MGLYAFPLGRTFRGYVERDGTSNTGLSGMWRKRVILSFVLLNIFPLLYFFFFLRGLSEVSISFYFSSLSDFFYVVFIFWSALGVFGFNRIYIAIATWKWKSLFCDVDLEDRPISFDAWAHFIWGTFFYLLPPLLIVTFLNCLM